MLGIVQGGEHCGLTPDVYTDVNDQKIRPWISGTWLFPFHEQSCLLIAKMLSDITKKLSLPESSTVDPAFSSTNTGFYQIIVMDHSFNLGTIFFPLPVWEGLITLNTVCSIENVKN